MRPAHVISVLGSAGCQPAVAGNPADNTLPRVVSRSNGDFARPRQAAETYRLAACAPQT
jgi:hypothetical protein